MLNISIFLEQSAKRNPDKPSLSFEGKTLTYKELNEKSNQVANALVNTGIRHGDNVALLCPNIPDFIVLFFGILKVGARVVPLNTLLKTEEIAYHLTDSDATAFFCFSSSLDDPLAKFGMEAFKKMSSCRFLIGIGNWEKQTITVEDFIKGQSVLCESFATSPDDTAVLIYTSGTTGKPKGAELSHLNLFTNAEASVEILKSKEFEIQMVVLPLFHIFGLTVMMLAGIRKTLRLILVPRFEVQKVISLIQEFQINIFAGVPSMYWMFLNNENAELNTNPFDSVRICVSGGASLPTKIIEDFETRFGVPIIEGYGMSEGSPVVTFNQLDYGRKPGSIGKPIWGIEVKIIDDNNNELPPNEKGELIFRGPNVMKSYCNREKETKETIKNGWLYSGDIAFKDEDGFFFIVDRKKELIIRGGMNVYPREIEETMMQHPDISMAAIIGMADDKLGEEVKAFVIRKIGSTISANEIIDWTKTKMAAYKYPRIVEFVTELPLGGSGKVLKNKLKSFTQ